MKAVTDKRRKPKPGDNARDWQNHPNFRNVYISRENGKTLFKVDGSHYFLNRWVNKWVDVKGELNWELSGCGGSSEHYEIISEEQAIEMVINWKINPKGLFDSIK